ncbi:MAG: hypothetical protein A2214_01165 [Candidatus Harrisonbacteria bacterium RIFOXYA1_FULL_48_8]|uniref:RNA binding S1 domain protein n=3 Tax=Parcubacteria group TaxID=1794811 RepID=A0A0G1T3W3_9BACT|nr:MAG: RNA binding S1 domain protein [Candidatus Giovannonibacteria bacterium GW2011_GWB1_47_6b]KKU93099.1 MAG: RNA binding S1 domain protein [Parcubacteria group bacterium GW2011_GWA1_48_11b]OGY64904.1 MAG: hypothetical protein A3E64_00170 [Candidatus Harrisonbacteria bacterium RIFCSPHIGHO2_12_FULL_48_16]OGY68625.1 MAG: hypothetical protein A2214_01165 [Candidatus Harrisonbacteria bacterium RIFOXYA1_FULL_48_8]
MNLPAKTLSALGQLIKNEAGLVSVFKNGDLVEGKIIKKTAKAIYFDLGPFGTGIVYGSELMNAQDVLKNLKVGDVATAKVVDQENDDGYVELSLREVGKQKAWQEIKELKESGELMTVKISGSNSGGLTTEINQLKAFIPVSQLATDHFPKVDDGDRNKISEELKKLIGLELKVKIIDVNPRSNKIIVSERETASENIKELLTKYKVGDVIDGIISGVADFGAFLQFVDNPKVEGMIHISELDHRLIENPKEVVKIGDAVKAKIIEMKDNRVSLSLKALKPNPWDTAESKYKVGEEYAGTVTRFNPYGAFVALDQDIQGLIHVSEFGGIEEMKKQIEIGKSYQFKIEQMRPAEKRIILKLKK